MAPFDSEGGGFASAAGRVGLFGLLLLCPLPFGSVQPWAVLGLQLYAACLGGLAAWLVAAEPGRLTGRPRRLFAVAALLPALGLLQLLPLPRPVVEFVAHPTASARASLGALLPEIRTGLAPESLVPPATLDAVLRLAAYLLFGLTAVAVLRRPRHLTQAVVVIAAAGMFQAVYGAGEYLSGHQHIFGYQKIHALDSASGTFINRNHFASFLAITLPFALGLVVYNASSAKRLTDWRAGILRLTDPGFVLFLFGLLASFTIWVGVLLSYSRGGLVAALVATVTFGVLASARRGRWRYLALLTLVPAAFLMRQEILAPAERFVSDASGPLGIGSRVDAWRAGLEMVPDYLFLGSGLGSFGHAFYLYRSPVIVRRWGHLHNDWLQAMIEGGLIQFLVLVLLAVLLLWPGRRRHGETHPAGVRVHSCALAALAAVAMHSVFDFSLRIPAIAVLTVCIVALAAATADRGGSPASPRPFDGGRRSEGNQRIT